VSSAKFSAVGARPTLLYMILMYFSANNLPGKIVNRWHCCRCCRFVDAPGEPQRPCSQCSEIFDSDSELAEHIAAHDREDLCFVCPMCNTKFPQQMPTAEFEVHVNAHFDQ